MWHWLELEEQIGRLWHRLIGQTENSYPHYPAATVTLDSVHAALRTFFHGMGGDHGLLLTATLPQTTRHRLRWKQRLGHHQEKLPQAELGPERLLLPVEISLFPEVSLNRQLYFANQPDHLSALSWVKANLSNIVYLFTGSTSTTFITCTGTADRNNYSSIARASTACC